MSNAGSNLTMAPVGSAPGPLTFDLPVKASTHIYRGTLVAQVSGNLAPYSTSSSGVAVGVAQHEADNSSGSNGDIRCVVECKRLYAFATADHDETTAIGSVAYGTDDHTVSKSSSSESRQPVGFFYGMEADGKARIYIDPAAAKIVAALQALASPADAAALRASIIAAFG